MSSLTKNCSQLIVFMLLLLSTAFPLKIKVIVGQDARGLGISDQQAILVFLQSEKFDVLGLRPSVAISGCGRRHSMFCGCWRFLGAPMFR
jgi:hypothetical protein